MTFTYLAGVADTNNSLGGMTPGYGAAPILAGDLSLLVVHIADTGTPTTPSGWTPAGGNPYQNSTSLKTYVYWKYAVGGEENTTVTVTTTATNVLSQLMTYRADTAGRQAQVVSFQVGIDSTSNTAISATTGSFTTVAGDRLRVLWFQNANGTAPTARTLTQAGNSLTSTLANPDNFGSATGFRYQTYDASVTTGATGTAVWAATASVAHVGHAVIVQMREILVSTPKNINVGQNTQTESATSPSRIKRRGSGQQIEAESSLSPTRSKRRSVAIQAAGDTALAMTRQKRRSVGQVTAVNSAMGFVGPKRITIGLVTAVNTAQQIIRTSGRLVNQLIQTNLAQTVGELKRKSVGIATEAGSSTITAKWTRKNVGLTAAADAARPMSVLTGAKRIGVAQAIEGDVSPNMSGFVGFRTDWALSMKVFKKPNKSITQVINGQLAQAMGKRERKTLSTSAGETELAQTIRKVKSERIGLAIEFDDNEIIIPRRARLLFPVEAEQAFPFGSSAVRDMGQARDFESVTQRLDKQKRKHVNLVWEVFTHLALKMHRGRAAGIVAETESALSTTKRKRKGSLNTITVDSALPLQVRSAYQVNSPVESETALSMSERKRVNVGIASDNCIATAPSRVKRHGMLFAAQGNAAIGIIRGAGIAILPGESDEEAITIRSRKSKTFAAATDAHTGTVFREAKGHSLIAATESDVSRLLVRGPKFLQGKETESALKIQPRTGRGINMTEAPELARSIMWFKRKGVGQATNTGSARTISVGGKFGQTNEVEEVHSVTASKRITVNVASDVSIATTTRRNKIKTLTSVSSLELARNLNESDTVWFATHIEQSMPVKSRKTYEVRVAQTLDQAVSGVPRSKSYRIETQTDFETALTIRPTRPTTINPAEDESNLAMSMRRGGFFPARDPIADWEDNDSYADWG